MTDTPMLDPVLDEAAERLSQRPGPRRNGDPDAPGPVDHQAAEWTPRRPQAVVALEDALTPLADALAAKGDVLWRRTVDWQRLQQQSHDQRGGGKGDGLTDDDLDEILGDAAASRYHTEVADLFRRMAADATRLQRLMQIVVPSQPSKPKGKDMLAAQVAAEGWCVSCWRDDQALVPIAVRTSGPDKGRPYYRDLCRFCGGWKAEHGTIPSLDVVQRHHDGRRIQRKAG